jgi:hypothetical protein
MIPAAALEDSMLGFLRHIVVWLFLFGAMAAPEIPSVARYWRLAHAGVWTDGVVQAQTYHRQVAFSFVVGGRAYTGLTRTGIADVPRYEALSPGTALPVVYLQSSPHINDAGDPSVHLDREWGDLGGLGVFTAVVLAINGFIIRITPGDRYRGMPKRLLLKWL